METMRLEIIDRIICLFLIEKKVFILESVDYVLINELDPASDCIGSVLDALIICVDPASLWLTVIFLRHGG